MKTTIFLKLLCGIVMVLALLTMMIWTPNIQALSGNGDYVSVAFFDLATSETALTNTAPSSSSGDVWSLAKFRYRTKGHKPHFTNSTWFQSHPKASVVAWLKAHPQSVTLFAELDLFSSQQPKLLPIITDHI